MTATRVISSVERVRSSVNGNPRFRVRFTDGSCALTKPNAGFAYEVGNPDMREGSHVEVTFTRSGTIGYMQGSAA